MAFNPACTCCTAWLPVSAPSAEMYCSCRNRYHRRSAPKRASVCSTWIDPRSFATCWLLYGRLIPIHLGFVCHSLVISAALCGNMVHLRRSALSQVDGIGEGCGKDERSS